MNDLASTRWDKILKNWTKAKISSGLYETWYKTVVEVNNFEFEVKNSEVKIADSIWRPKFQNFYIIV